MREPLLAPYYILFFIFYNLNVKILVSSPHNNDTSYSNPKLVFSCILYIGNQNNQSTYLIIKENIMESFEIYFSDLNEDAQKRLLEAVHAKTAADMNWDMDIIPIAVYEIEELEGDETDNADE